jgi:hypothetical protein
MLAISLLLGCKGADQPQASGGTGGVSATGGVSGVSGSGGKEGSGGSRASSGGDSGASGGSTGSGGQSGSGGSSAGQGGSMTAGGSSGGAGGADAGGSGGAGPADASVDKPAAETGGSDRPGILGEGADYPGRAEVRICPKDWTHEQCCAFLCRCLNELCTDSPKGKPGIASCMTWCPKLSNMAMRCHVYHCFESVSTGGKKDHDSHCGHAADQVAGGMCRADVYN